MKRFPLVLFPAVALLSTTSSALACRSTFATGNLRCESADGKTRLLGDYQDIGAEDDHYTLWVFSEGRAWDLKQPNLGSKNASAREQVFFGEYWHYDRRPTPATSIFFAKPEILSTETTIETCRSYCSRSREKLKITAVILDDGPAGYIGPKNETFFCEKKTWYQDDGA